MSETAPTLVEDRRWCHALTPFPVNGDFGECPLRYGHTGPHKVTFAWSTPKPRGTA